MKQGYIVLMLCLFFMGVGGGIGWTRSFQLIFTDEEEKDCTAEVEEAHHQEGEHYRNWEACTRDVDIYVRQSMEAVCLDLYDQWNSYLDGCWEDKWECNSELQDCEVELLNCEVAMQLRVKN